MSKAFDSINRNILINDLKDIINIDELHLIKILLEVKLAVKCGNHTTEFFNTHTGALHKAIAQVLINAPSI